MSDADAIHQRSTAASRVLRAPTVVVMASVIAMGALVVSLWGMSIARVPTDAAGSYNLEALQPWWIASAVLWLGLSLLWWKLNSLRCFRRQGECRWRVAWLVLIIALLARIAVLIGHDPALSDDIYRYIFDGRNVAAGENPYMVLPAERIDAPAQRWPGERATAAQLNNPGLHTIYLPVSQWVFGAAGSIAADQWSDPNAAARLFRAVFILFDMAIIAWVVLILRRAGQSPWWAALYAWHPLVITEIAGSGHQDVIGIALMMAGLGAYELWLSRRRVWAWITPLALSALVKPVAVVIAVLMLRGRRVQHWFIGGAVAALVGFVVAGPLLLTHDAEPLEDLRETASTFTAKWAHFGSMYQPALAALDVIDPIDNATVQWQRKEAHERWARYVCAGVVGLTLLIVLWRRTHIWTAARIILLVMVLASPTAHPWYLLWALALMPMAGMACGGALTLWVLSLTLPWGYAALGDTAEWTTPTWVYAAAYIPVYGAAAYELWTAAQRRRLNTSAVF